MVDFFEDVEENLRADRLRSLAKTYLPWAGGVLAVGLAAAFGYWGFTVWQANVSAKAADVYDKAVQAQAGGDLKAAESGYDAVTKMGAPGFAVYALQAEAGLKAQQGDRDAAIKLYDAAADQASSPTLKDLARLKAAYLVLDKGDFGGADERLKPLAEKDRPYRPLAREAQAMADLATGKLAQAREIYAELAIQQDSPQQLRNRAEQAKRAIDSGAAAHLIDIAKVAEKLPPPPVNVPSQVTSGAPQ